MPSPAEVVAPRVVAAMVAAFGDEYRDSDPVVRPSKVADVQCNAALALAKPLGMPPRQVAERLVANLEVADLCDRVEIGGPGFVNLSLADSWIAAQLEAMVADPGLGVVPEDPLVIPVDYSSPNVAKQMHVGHLRTTVVGDALVRTLERLGHTVIRQNHIGDWGTPFGMLIEHLIDVGEDSPDAGLLESDPNAFYQAARAAFDADPAVAARARARVVALQAGDPETLRLWRGLVDRSRSYFRSIYRQLGVTLTDADLAGESTYNDELASICDELQARGIATVSDGALCVFLDGFTGRDAAPVPLIVRKSDGGYGYATTDLATVRHRVTQLHADRILYVVGAAQSLHLQMVFAAARLAGWLPESVAATHVQIGNVLGEDRKLLRTRSGDSMRLTTLVDQAVDRATDVVEQARPDLDPATRSEIARYVGVGAIKYADLSVAHDSEYVFDLDRMVSLVGNTGPYLQYAVARIRSIFRAAGIDPASVHGPIGVSDPAERALALRLLDYGGVVAQVGQVLEPHRLCGYLFDLAQHFSAFYEKCPVLRAEDDVRTSRLQVCAATLGVLVDGLDLLGVDSPEQM